MAVVQLKMFGGNDLQKIEGLVNTWLAALPAHAVVQRTETTATTVSVPGKAGTPIWTVSIWHET